jgi:hypothetical protein
MKTNKSPILPLVPSPDDKAGMSRYMQSVNQFLQDLSLNARADLDTISGSIVLPYRVGQSLITQEEITLSATDPWFNISTPTTTLSTANFVDYVPYLRAITAGPRWTSAVLTGTVTLAAGVLTGSGTNFDPELTVGDLVFIEKLNQFRYIATRTSDTAATVSEPGTAAAGARMWKITKATSKTTTFPITSYQITGATSFSLWFNEGSTTKQPENYILMRALAEAYAYDREYGTLTLPEAIGDIPAGDYQITGVTLANVGSSSEVITCSATGLTPGAETASTADISIYPHRIAGSTTTARHKELTDAAIMNDGLYNVLGEVQEDQGQGHWHIGRGGVPGVVSTDIWNYTASSLKTSEMTAVRDAITDGTNGTPRTGPRTRPRSGIFNFYAYVGTYAA